MKQMPYNVPDGFIEMSKMRNRAALRRVEAQRRRNRHIRHIASMATALACVAVGIVGYVRWNSATPMDNLIALMESASDDLIYEMSCDAVEYPEDINMLW